MALNEKQLDLSGKRFGRLIVLEYFLKEKMRHYYLCDCDCGNETIVRRNELLSHDTRSCGCLQRHPGKCVYITNHMKMKFWTK